MKSRFGYAILGLQTKKSMRPPTAKSRKSDLSESSNASSIRKHKRRKRLKEMEKEQFIEAFSKRSEFNDVRVSEK